MQNLPVFKQRFNRYGQLVTKETQEAMYLAYLTDLNNQYGQGDTYVAIQYETVLVGKGKNKHWERREIGRQTVNKSEYAKKMVDAYC